MRRRFLIFLCLILAGCVVTTKPLTRQLTNVSDLSLGMTKQQVKAAMGGEVIVGYERDDSTSAQFVPVTMKNPVRIDYLQSAGKNYEIDFYFTQIKQADGTVSDDETTPMTFENNKLVGKDWDYLNNLKKLSQY